MRRPVILGGAVALAMAAAPGLAVAQPMAPPPVCATTPGGPADPAPTTPPRPGAQTPADPDPADSDPADSDPAAPDRAAPPSTEPAPGDADDCIAPPTTLPVQPPTDSGAEPTATGTAPAPTGAGSVDRSVAAQPSGNDAGGDAGDAQPAGVSNGHETSAAAVHGWGEPTRVEEFDGPLGRHWGVYDGPGHAGNGRRTPSAVSVADGELTITGNSRGHTAGMAWLPGQKYGRWEGRVRAPASDPSYNALLLLWPTAENFPVGGEIDFMEMTDHTRQSTQLFLHYGPNNDQVFGEVAIDGTRWNNWAVEWTPNHVAAFVNGKEWWRTEDTSILPPGPMHLCIQLDWFPRGGRDVRESSMHVDWVKQYALSPEEIVDEATESIDRRIQDRLTRATIGTGVAELPGVGAVVGAAEAARAANLGRRTEGGPDPAPLSGAAQRAPSGR